MKRFLLICAALIAALSFVNPAPVQAGGEQEKSVYGNWPAEMSRENPFADDLARARKRLDASILRFWDILDMNRIPVANQHLANRILDLTCPPLMWVHFALPNDLWSRRITPVASTRDRVTHVLRQDVLVGADLSTHRTSTGAT